MDRHNELGKEGEAMAEEWLIQNGYDILFRNWRTSHYEIDIIAIKNNMVHFIEVKTRNASSFGFPENSVTRKKFRFLKKAADEFLQHYSFDWIQYDILAITLYKNKPTEFYLLQDVFL